MLVAEQLHFDVPRSLNEFLDEDIRAAEGGKRLTLCLFVLGHKVGFVADDTHPASAAAVRSFQNHGEAQRLGKRESFVRIHNRSLTAAEHRHSGRLGNFAGDRLVTELVQRLDTRSNERDSVVFAGLCELWIFRQKAVTGMNRINTVLAANVDDRVDVEVRLDRFTLLADLIRLVRFKAMQGEAVLVRVNRNGANAQLIGRAEDANRDFGAIRHQQFFDLAHINLTGKLAFGWLGSGWACCQRALKMRGRIRYGTAHAVAIACV